MNVPPKIAETISKIKGTPIAVDATAPEASFVEGMVRVARDLGCLGDLLGREYEVRTPQGEVVFIIHQKPITVKQYGMVASTLEELNRKDREESEALEPPRRRGRR